MAGGLTAGLASSAASTFPWRALAVAVALALLGHLVTLIWLAATWQVPMQLQAMAAPLLTRQILPSSAISVPKVPDASVKSIFSASKIVASAVLNTTPTQATSAQVSEPESSSAATPAVGGGRSGTSTLDVAPASVSTPASTPAQAVAAATPPPEPAPQADAFAQWPVDTRLSYTMGGFYRGDLHGSAQVLWQRQADHYQVKLAISLGPFSPAFTSQGRVLPEGLHPTAYEEQLPTGRRGLVLTDTDLVMDNGQRMPRPPRAQDSASQFVDLTWRFLSGGAQLQQGATVRYWLARPGGADEWVYDVVALETLQTRLGPLPAWHLVPRPLARPRGNITAEMWFAPSLQYLPVRIKMNIGADANVDLLIDKVEQGGK